MRRGEQVVYLHTQMWRSRISWLTPSVYVVPSDSAPSASGRPASRYSTCGASSLYFTVSPSRMLTAKTIPSPMSKTGTVTFVHILSSSLAPYSMTPSVSILTGYGVVFQRGWDIVHLDLYLMLRTRGSFLLALLLTRRCFVFRAFFSIYK